MKDNDFEMNEIEQLQKIREWVSNESQEFAATWEAVIEAGLFEKQTLKHVIAHFFTIGMLTGANRFEKE